MRIPFMKIMGNPETGGQGPNPRNEGGKGKNKKGSYNDDELAAMYTAIANSPEPKGQRPSPQGEAKMRELERKKKYPEVELASVEGLEEGGSGRFRIIDRWKGSIDGERPQKVLNFIERIVPEGEEEKFASLSRFYLWDDGDYETDDYNEEDALGPVKYHKTQKVRALTQKIGSASELEEIERLAA
ncbi:MAG: hypothetical protein WCW16_03110 [Candidatus Magasanikbacteria bacterium]